MVVLLIAVAIAQQEPGPSTPTGAREDPRTVVRDATRAVEAEHGAQLRAVWQARLERGPDDRAALLGLATLARLAYDYSAAEELLSRLIAADVATPGRFTAYALLGRAWASEERGFSNDAEAHFERARRAARLARDGAAEAEALIALSFVSGRMSGVPAAMKLLERARRLSPRGDFELEADLLRHRAVLLGVAGNPDAMTDAEAGIAAAGRAGLFRVEAQALRAAGKVMNFQGQNDAAIAFFQRSETMFRRAHERSWLAATLTEHAGSLLEQGELGEGMETLRAALTEAEASHNLQSIGVAHIGFADVAMHVNDVASATEHLNRAAAMYEAQGDPSNASIPRRYLAFLALAAGNAAEARKLVLQDLAFYENTGEAPDIFELRRMLAAIAMREGDWAEAAREIGDAEAFARKLRMERWSANLALDSGLLAMFRGDLDEAERSLDAYLRTLEPSQAVSRHHVRLRIAEIHVRRGDLARAEAESIAAWDDLDRWRATLSDRELRLLAFQTSPAELKTPLVGKSDQDASIARILGALASGGRVASAFELAERRRARDLFDALLQAEALRAGVRSVREPGARGADAVTAAAAAASLPDESTALIEFLVGRPDTSGSAFVIQRKGIRAYPIGVAGSLSAQVARLVGLLEAGTDPAELAQELGRALLEPALAQLDPGVTRVVIIPDGPLHRLPWDALRLADGRHVIERYAVSIAPSAAVVAALWRRARERGSSLRRPVAILAFGDPSFGETVEIMRSAFDASGGLPRLEASAREVELIAGYTRDAEIRVRDAASAAYLKTAPLERFGILHFATHAVVDEGTAARTALALAPGGGESGFVSPGELAALRLDADLVVLSACRTARGVLVEGEGVQGLTAPLLQAGARSVVATSWRIGDQTTVAIVRSLYDALATGLPVGDAVRAAKLDALHRGATPKEWAVFTAVGDPLVRVSLTAPPSGSRRWLLGTMAFFLVAGGAAAAGLIRVRRLRERSRREVIKGAAPPAA